MVVVVDEYGLVLKLWILGIILVLLFLIEWFLEVMNLLFDDVMDMIFVEIVLVVMILRFCLKNIEDFEYYIRVIDGI